MPVSDACACSNDTNSPVFGVGLAPRAEAWLFSTDVLERLEKLCVDGLAALAFENCSISLSVSPEGM